MPSGEYVVGDVHRHLLVGKGVQYETAGERTTLLEARTAFGRRRALELTLGFCSLDQFVHLNAVLLGGQVIEQRMFGGYDRVGDAKARVWSRREDSQRPTRILGEEGQTPRLRIDRSSCAAWS